MAETLEEKVEGKESKGFVKKALKLGWKLGMAAATTALSMSTVGTLGVMVGAAFAGGGMIAGLANGKSLYDTINEGLTTYSAVNAVIHPIVWLGDMTFPLISNYDLTGQIMRGLYASTLYNAAFVGSFRATSHLIDNYMNPKGIVKSVKDGFLQQVFNVGVVFSPAYFAAANGIKDILIGGYAIPTFAAWALPSGFILDYFLKKDKKHPNPYHMPSYSPAYAH